MHRDGLLPGVLLLVLSAIWMGVPLRAGITGAEPIPGLGMPGALLAFVIGAGFALWSFAALIRCRKITVDDHGVVVRDHRLGGVSEWRAPLADYLGVKVSGRAIQAPRGCKLLYHVELRHDDPARTLTLATSKDWHQAAVECRALARVLGLEQLEDSGAAGAIPEEDPGQGKTKPEADASPKAIAPKPGAVSARV